MVKIWSFLSALLYARSGEIHGDTFKYVKKTFRKFRNKDDASKFILEQIENWVEIKKKKKEKKLKTKLKDSKHEYEDINIEKIMENQKELLKLLRDKISQSKMPIEDIFDAIDDDGNGSLDINEF